MIYFGESSKRFTFITTLAVPMVQTCMYILRFMGRIQFEIQNVISKTKRICCFSCLLGCELMCVDRSNKIYEKWPTSHVLLKIRCQRNKKKRRGVWAGCDLGKYTEKIPSKIFIFGIKRWRFIHVSPDNPLKHWRRC